MCSIKTNRMKHLIFILALLTFIGCNKEEELVVNNTNTPITTYTIAGTYSCIQVCDRYGSSNCDPCQYTNNLVITKVNDTLYLVNGIQGDYEMLCTYRENKSHNSLSTTDDTYIANDLYIDGLIFNENHSGANYADTSYAFSYNIIKVQSNGSEVVFEQWHNLNGCEKL